MLNDYKLNIIPKWLIIILAIFLIVSFLAIFAYLGIGIIYKNKIYPNIFLGGADIGGKTLDEAKAIINQKADLINQNGIYFIYQQKKINISPMISSADNDLVYQIITFNIEKSLNNTWQYGRGDNFIYNISDRIYSFVRKNNFSVNFSINGEEIEKILKENLVSLEKPAEDARLNYATETGKGDIIFSVMDEKIGKKINYDLALLTLENNLKNLKPTEIILQETDDYPKIYKKDCLNIDAKAKKIISQAPISLYYNEYKNELKKDLIASWLVLKINTDSQNGDKIIVEIDKKAVANFLDSEAAAKINREPVQPKFEMQDGRVRAFQVGQDGLKIDVASTANRIINAINNQATGTQIAVTPIASNTGIENENDLGIKEIIGTGHSNFKGSPKNRRHNIKTGANSLNGILIKPDEEFSLVKTLGEIEAKTGYLPELVIKGNKTVPEYGGGLCQIGTTVFRGALESGLPITARRNHSYRVSYYEPAGTDATIYNPSPDLKFKNDTGNYILIQSRIDGDNLYFDFWGAKDGRIIHKTEPKITNIVKPGPTKIIETIDLKPGEKKCIETAHNGADAYFDYKVTYPDGTIKEKRFSSHYVPWRAVCLLGVEKLTPENTVSTTSVEKITQ